MNMNTRWVNIRIKTETRQKINEIDHSRAICSLTDLLIYI